MKLNWSTLKFLATSPKLLKWRVDHPEPESIPLRLGRAIHCAILEPDKFEGRWISTTTCQAQTRAGEPCRAEGSRYFDGLWFCGVRGHAPPGATNTPGEGIEVIDAEGLKLTRLCAESVKAHAPSSKLLAGGHSEQEIEWVDAESGIECRGRVDYLRPDVLIDLKSTRRETVRDFVGDVARNLYHGQVAWYTDGAIQAGRLPADAKNPYIIAVSTAEPYDVTAYQLSQATLEAGRILVRDLIAKYQECTAAGYWPGIAPDMQTLEIPNWSPGMNGSETDERW